MKPIVDWELTETEVCFALCQILWNYAARKLNGQTQRAADVFLEEISNNLHEFYRKEQKTRNYAARLTVIMEMVNNVLVSSIEVHDHIVQSFRGYSEIARR